MKTQIEKEYNPGKKSLLPNLKRTEHSTIKNTIKRLDTAINLAQSVERPNRYQLLEIYYDIIKDPHLQSVIKHRRERIKGLEYSIIKNNGKKDLKMTQFFNTSWFKKFLTYAIDSIFYGNSLVEILSDKGELSINLIPRENVIPEFKELKFNPTNQNGDIDYTVPAYSNSLIDINNEDDSRNLGELLSIAKYVLIKSEVLLNWSQYIEIFGQPLRIATTDTEDPTELNAIYKFLEELGRSGFMVKNSQTDVEFQNAASIGTTSDLYKEFENFVDEQVSKKILGGTMITDSGSSRSQSEVHERSSYLYTKADISYIEDIVNNELIPLLINKGIIGKKGLEFRFREPEVITVEDKLKIDEFLLANFNVKDIEYFEDRYRVGLEFKDRLPSIDVDKQVEDDDED